MAEKKSDIEVIPSQVLTTKEAVSRRDALEKYVAECMVLDVDYNNDERTNKKNLLQAGADKVLNLYGLTSRAEIVQKNEDWEKGFFHYEVKSQIIWPRKMEDGTIREEVIAEGMGSCNSRESKYAYRWMTLAEMSKETKALAEKGAFKTETREKDVPLFTLSDEDKARAVDEKWPTSEAIGKGGRPYKRVVHPGVTMYRIPNEDIFDQVNTILKMAKKRSYVDATIRATKAGDLFTQDLEDLPNTGAKAPAKEKPKPEGKADADKPKDKPKKEAPAEAEVVETLTDAEKASLSAKFEEKVKGCKDHDELNALYREIPQGAKQDVYAAYSRRYKELSNAEKTGGDRD